MPSVAVTRSLLTIALLAGAACTQPGDTGPGSGDAPAGQAGPQDAPETAMPEDQTPPRLQRPEGVINSPGPGTPSGQVSASISVSDMPGRWHLVLPGGDEPAEIQLEARTGEAAGTVSVISGWPDQREAPANWIYLALGSLTLTTETGERVWSGTPVSGEAFNGTFAADRQKARLVRTDD